LQAIEHLLLLGRQRAAHLHPNRVSHDPQPRQELIEDRIGPKAILLEDLLYPAILIVGQMQLLSPLRGRPMFTGRWVKRSRPAGPLERYSRERSDRKDERQQENSLELHAPQRLEVGVHRSARLRPRRSAVVGLSLACTQRATCLGMPKASASVVCDVVDGCATARTITETSATKPKVARTGRRQQVI
jgi:hypothetical protein